MIKVENTAAFGFSAAIRGMRNPLASWDKSDSYRAEMPNLVKAARGFDSDYEEAMYKWKTCDNLYIDDLLKLSGRMSKGNLVDTDRDEMRILFDLVNARYVNNLTTLFSSELSLNEITRIDGALGSRIYDMIKPYGIGVSGANERLRRI